MKTELLTKTEQNKPSPEPVAGLYRDERDGEVIIVTEVGEITTIVQGTRCSRSLGEHWRSSLFNAEHFRRLRGIQDIRFHCQ